MQTKTYTVYKFDELPKESQAKAIEKYRDINTDYDWYQFLFESKAEELKNKGFLDIDIRFSGFSSQGDGASFTAKIDMGTWLKANKLAAKYRMVYNHEEEMHGEIRQSGMYQHEMTMSILLENYGESNDKIEDDLGTLENLILESAREEARKIYKDLEEIYWDLVSDESVAETLRINEYDLTEDGIID